jgi:hypothetical protein
MDEIIEIQHWYLNECDGDWEHEYGVRIETLDNPGWVVEIDVAETGLEAKPFEPVGRGVGVASIDDDQDWYICNVQNKKFTARCGPHHLQTVLKIFLDWAALES